VNLTEHGLNIELHAYQCHVFLDWRELRSTAERPWERLCDELGGRGVPDLDDALLRLELRPMHDALRQLLDPALVRHLPDVAERAPAGPEKEKALELLREDFFHTAWKRCREFLREAQAFYRSHGGQAPTIANPAVMEKRFHDRVRAAMRIPALESLFPKPWPTAARRVLPCPSPQLTATAMWGPVLAWTVLEVLAESVNAREPETTALDLFDRLRLREPLGQAFQLLGFEAEESWRVAARIKVALLIEAGVFTAEEPALEAPAIEAPAAGPIAAPTLPLEAPVAAPTIPPSERPIPVLSPALWQDPDVRWLTGEHVAEGHSYFVKESFEELLWWLQLPALCKLAAESMPTRSGIQQISRTVADASEAAELAGYRVEALFP
jgi:hypothetical protein